MKKYKYKTPIHLVSMGNQIGMTKNNRMYDSEGISFKNRQRVFG